VMKSRPGDAPLPRADSADVMCGICMEHPELVRLTRCGHSLCATCARQLLAVAASSACACPFCRKYIGGFASCKQVDSEDA
jgi:Zinc finger, C3HC4 type (RING finger)